MVGLMRSSLACLGLLLVSACASQPPAERSATDWSYLDQQRAETDNSTLTIFADACVIRDVVGDDLVRRDASEGMPLKAGLTLRTMLADRGNTVTSSTVYTVCAATEPEVDQMPWAEGWDRAKQAPPGPWLQNPTTEQALAATLQRAVRDQVATATGGYALRPLGLSDSDLAGLRAAHGADRAWVIQLAGIDVGVGKQVSQGLWYSLLAWPATLAGAFSAPGSPGQERDSIWRGGIDDDLQRYTVALVDLNSGQLVWWKASGWTDAGQNFGAAYDAEWVLRATRPMYR